MIPVTQGGVYYAQAAAFYGGTGTFQLQFAVDNFGKTLAQATPITLSAAGAGGQNGTIAFPGDVDYFQFTAPVSGTMGIQQVARQVAGQPSNVDSFLYVYANPPAAHLQQRRRGGQQHAEQPGCDSRSPPAHLLRQGGGFRQQRGGLFAVVQHGPRGTDLRDGHADHDHARPQ